MTYTEIQERSDLSFLVGANYGRATALADLQSEVTDVLRVWFDEDDDVAVGSIWQNLADRNLALYDSSRGITP